MKNIPLSNRGLKEIDCCIEDAMNKLDKLIEIILKDGDQQLLEFLIDYGARLEIIKYNRDNLLNNSLSSEEFYGLVLTKMIELDSKMFQLFKEGKYR